MTINDRIGLLMRHLGYTKYQLKRQLGIKSSSTIPNILNNPRRRPSYDVINRILTRFSNVDARWLITGEGDMFMKETDIPLINDRIIRVMEYYGHDRDSFVKRIDLSPEEIIPVLEKKSDPTEKLLRTVEACFQNINPQWLRYNQGKKMFKGRIGVELEKQDGSIPYYHIEIINDKPTLTEPVSVIRINGFKDCNLSVSVWGSSMTPDFNPGEIILCRTSSKDLIMYGEAYLIFAEKTILLRYVKMSDKKEHIVLTSSNERYDPVLLPKSTILDLYLVKGKIIRHLI